MNINTNISMIQVPQSLIDTYAFRLPGSYKFADYIWPGLLFSPERLQLVKDVRFHPEDVLIVSYPKSGTTWVSELVSLIVNNGDADKVKHDPLHERVPWLEMDQRHIWVIGKFRGVRKDEIVDGDVIENDTLSSGRRGRRVWFTHLPLELMPTQALEGGCKVIYVSRNPKDTAVSFFHFHQMARFLGQQKTSWDEFFSLYTSGNVYCGSWFEHVIGFWRLMKINKNMLFLKYEDLIKNLSSEVDKICKFLNIELPASTVANVVEHCTFRKMKDNKMTNREGIWLFNHRVSNFMRKGVVGDWKNYFTVAQNELFDEVYRRKMSSLDLGYEFQQ